MRTVSHQVKRKWIAFYLFGGESCKSFRVMNEEELTPVDFFADAHDAAVLRIADVLRHPDDLTNKLKMLRKKVAMERASVETQLKIVIKSQLDSTQKGIDSLHKSKEESTKIFSLLNNMNHICESAESKIKNYAFIQRVRN
jgi:hypothetical protein